MLVRPIIYRVYLTGFSSMVIFVFAELLQSFNCQISKRPEQQQLQQQQQQQQPSLPVPCVFEYNSSVISQGEIFSPFYPGLYPNNVNCRYELNGRDNELIILQVDDFQLESAQSTAVQEVNFLDLIETVTRTTSFSSTDQQVDFIETNNNQFPVRQCFYDFLDIFAVDKQGRSSWRSRHCGSSIDSKIVSTTPNLVLVFQSDRMLTFRGFKFRFFFSNVNIFPLVTQIACGQTQLSGIGGSLFSPKYPMAYPDNAECAWVITVKSFQTILVKFDDLNLNQRCKQSYVRIYDGYISDVNKPDFNVCEKLKFYHKGVQTFYSKTNRIVISFVANKALATSVKESRLMTSEADSSIQGKNENTGFKLTWTAVHLLNDCDGFKCKGGEYCIDEKNFLCQQTFKYCIAKELACDGMFNCDVGDKSDEMFCQLSIMRTEYLYILAAGIVCLVLLIALGLYVKSKLKRKTYTSKFKHTKENIDAEIVETKYNPAKKVITMPIPHYIDLNALRDPDMKQDPSIDSFQEIENKKKQILSSYDLKKKDSTEEMMMSRLKLVRNSFEVNNKNDFSSMKGNKDRKFIVRQVSVPITKETWINQNLSQNSNQTNSSSLNSVKTEDSENDTDNSTSNTKTEKSKKYMQTETVQVKTRNKSNTSITNSLRRNSYTKAIFFEDY